MCVVNNFYVVMLRCKIIIR